MSVADLIDQVRTELQWAGFRALTAAEASSGPFVRAAAGHQHVCLDPGAYTTANLAPLGSAADLAAFLENQALNGWGFDLNLESHASQTEIVNELRFAMSSQLDSMTSELAWCAFRQDGRSWWRSDADCLVPALGPDYRGEIFPCIGWVLIPGAPSEFGPAEHRSGFCTKDVPMGSRSNLDVRGYRFVYEGYPQRAITRRRIVVMLDPQMPAREVSATIRNALSLTYGAA